MSIIVEALKKAQGSLKTNISSRGGNTPPLPPPEMRKPRIKKHVGVWVFASFLLLTAVSFYFLNRNLIKKDLLPTVLKEEESPPVLSSLPALPPAPALVRVPASVPVPAPAPTPAPTATPSPAPPTLAVVNKAIDLNGIMYTPKKPQAIINGRVSSEGDYIGEFKISKIEKDLVRITSEGQEFIIRLRR